MSKILFAASEAHPLIKTGGLGDVAGSLPIALKSLRHDVRVVLPGYRSAIKKAGKLSIQYLDSPDLPGTIRILEGKLANSNVKLWLVDSPAHFDRDGGPYSDENGHEWLDNAERFSLFCRVVSAIATNKAGLEWQPNIVHCNDWQCGPIPALLESEKTRPATVFTIHNLAYQGLFPKHTFNNLNFPSQLWSTSAMEFYDQVSFLKGGLVFSDMINTVSPTYAKEILTPKFGCGLEGLMSHRRERLVGILNGVDYTVWDPTLDPYIEMPYNAATFRYKSLNKVSLQKQLGLPPAEDIPVLGFVGRLVSQKGVDLITDVIPSLMNKQVQFAFLGSGDKKIEATLAALCKKHPKKVAAHIGFSEELAHLVEAGSDMFLMPSRFEPCGLNQIYSLRYGTIPVVNNTGGLADTVINASEKNIKSGDATGFNLDTLDVKTLETTLSRALALYQQKIKWRKLATTGMKKDFSWKRSAKEYLTLYQQALGFSKKRETS